MKKFTIFSLICLLSTFMFVACERDEGVQAGREEDTGATAGRTGEYQPAPAPGTDINGMPQDVQGELIRIDTDGRAIVVRGQDGMEQTFTYNDQTAMMGMPQRDPAQGAASMNRMADLKGKEGSRVTVSWRQEGNQRIVTMVQVIRMKNSTSR